LPFPKVLSASQTVLRNVGVNEKVWAGCLSSQPSSAVLTTRTQWASWRHEPLSL
jgi:hypothetical protein